MDLYQKHRHSIRTGDVFLWASPGILGRLIRLRTRSTVNHASTALVSRYSGRVLTVDAEARGILPTVLSTQLARYRRGTVLWLPLKDTYTALRHQIGAALEDQYGRGYDYLSLVTQLWRRVRPGGKYLFCSESTFMAGVEAGLPGLDDMATAPQPGDYLRWAVFKMLYDSPVRIL